MTCIVGLSENGDVYMGADSAATDGWGNVTILKSPKVFEKDGMLIGVTGHVRMIQILRYAFDIPEHPEDMCEEEYMSTLFVDAMRDALKNGGYAKKESEQERNDSSILVGYRGMLFEVESNYQVICPNRDYHAIGSGMAWAFGAMYATQNERPTKRLRVALEAAEIFSNGVRGPFTLRSITSEGEPRVHLSVVTDTVRGRHGGA